MFDLGGLMGGTPTGDSQPANLEAKWMQKFQDPAVMAGLLSFGANLMKPTWTPGAAITDAITGGANAYAGVEAEKYRRAQEEEKRLQAADEKEADRSNQLEVAKIGADSRAEVANIRSAAMLNTLYEKDRLKKELTAGDMTPAELRVYLSTKKSIQDSIQNMNRNPKEVEAEADQIARDRIAGMRARGGGGASVPGENTSTNPANAGGPVGQPRPDGTAKNTSANSANKGPSQKPTHTYEQLKELMIKAGTWHPSFDSDSRRLKPYVSDPDYVDNLWIIQSKKKLKQEREGK